MMTADSDAYSLWDRARAAVTSAAYPHRIAYTIAISGFDGETLVSDHYRASFDPNDGTIRLFPISDEESAKPPVPHGFNMFLGLRNRLRLRGIFDLKIGHSPPDQDLLGEPHLTPTYMFGIPYAADTPEAPDTPAPRTDSPTDGGSLPLIASVSSRTADYRVSLVDLSTMDGVLTYHLALDPLRRPHEHRLRELWIGAADYLPRRAVIAGNFTQAAFDNAMWTIDFSVFDRAPYISREIAGGTLALPHQRIVRDAVIAFTDIRAPADMYDTPLLDPKLNRSSLVEPGPQVKFVTKPNPPPP